jgi:fructokinase
MKAARDLLAFGEVLWDIFQSKHPLRGDGFRREIGGAPANVSVQIARLGGTASVVGAVGRDHFGDELDRRLRAEGVDTSTLAHRAERTGIAFVLRTDDGQPRFLFYRQATADMAYGVRDLPARMPRARYALVGSSTLVVPALADATWTFIDRARRGGARLVSDLNVRAHLWRDPRRMRAGIARLLEPASLVKASADDLAALDVGPERRALDWVRARAPHATIFVTRGAGASSAFGAFGRVDVPARASRCVDATGAGDAFLAAVVRVLSALSEAERAAPSAAAVREAMRLGNAMGARVVRRPGAVAADTRPLRARCDRAIERLRAAL